MIVQTDTFSPERLSCESDRPEESEWIDKDFEGILTRGLGIVLPDS